MVSYADQTAFCAAGYDFWHGVDGFIPVTGYFSGTDVSSGVRNELRPAVWLLGLQLALNAAWTPVFFGMHHLAGALTIVVLMLLEGFLMHRSFARHNRVAAMLLWPYWAWLIFATYLTAGFMMLN